SNSRVPSVVASPLTSNQHGNASHDDLPSGPCQPRQRVPASVRAITDETGLERPSIRAGERANHRGAQEGRVPDVEQVLWNPPDITRRDHPSRLGPVETRQVDRLRVRAKRAVAAEVDIALEIAHHELAKRPIHGLTVAEAGEIGLGDGAPVTANPVY